MLINLKKLRFWYSCILVNIKNEKNKSLTYIVDIEFPESAESSIIPPPLLSGINIGGAGMMSQQIQGGGGIY